MGAAWPICLPQALADVADSVAAEVERCQPRLEHRGQHRHVHQFVNCAADPAYAAIVADYARKMLDWRLGYAERTLTGYRATPRGLEVRAA